MSLSFVKRFVSAARLSLHTTLHKKHARASDGLLEPFWASSKPMICEPCECPLPLWSANSGCLRAKAREGRSPGGLGVAHPRLRSAPGAGGTPPLLPRGTAAAGTKSQCLTALPPSSTNRGPPPLPAAPPQQPTANSQQPTANSQQPEPGKGTGAGRLAPNRRLKPDGLTASQWGQSYRRCSRAPRVAGPPSASFQFLK